MKQKIAFISITPDAGHVLPLLRLAVYFVEQQYEVRCFFPEECVGLAEEFGISIQSFGKVTTFANKEILYKISKRSNFYNAFTYYIDVILNYLHPISLAGSINPEFMKRSLAEYKPDLIIADHHLLPQYITYLGEYLNKKVVFHESGGNYRYHSFYYDIDRGFKFQVNGKYYRYSFHKYIFNYGFTGLSPLIQWLIVYFGNKLTDRTWIAAYHKSKKVEDIISANLKKAFPAISGNRDNSISISTGLPFVEKEITQKYFTVEPDLYLFPPTQDKRKPVIDSQLRQWINKAGEKPIVYICLGTMVHSNKKIIRKIVRGLKKLDIFILWVMPAYQMKMIGTNEMPNLRLEENVPQPQLLAAEKIRCFITHGGAGGIQDGLLNGKPMLCIPYMFDQPFNSSIVEMLQIGIKIWKNKVTSKSVYRAVHQLLYNPQYWNAAQQYMKKLQSMDSGAEVIRFLKEKKILKYQDD